MRQGVEILLIREPYFTEAYRLRSIESKVSRGTRFLKERKIGLSLQSAWVSFPNKSMDMRGGDPSKFYFLGRRDEYREGR